MSIMRSRHSSKVIASRGGIPLIEQGAIIGAIGVSGGTDSQDEVVSKAGTVYHLSLEQIKGAIREAGYVPRQRDVFYRLIDDKPAPTRRPVKASLPLVPA